MTYGTMELIQTVTVGSGGAANIEFTNIPQTYSDLKLVLSTRDSANVKYANIQMQFNNSGGTAYSERLLYATTSALSATNTSQPNTFFQYSTSATATASTFASTEIYIPNYAGSTNKSVSVDTVTEDNVSNTTIMGMSAQLWSNTAAITSIKLTPNTGGSTFVQHSTATLYGITRVPAGAKATGGVIYDDSSYWYHVFTSSGTFTPSQSLSCDVLVVAGGGGGAANAGGGGGAGGLLAFTAQSLSAQNYTVTVGAGGNGASGTGNGTTGSDSQFGSLTLVKGGGGGGTNNTAGLTGGSGGGGGGFNVGAGGAGTSGQGFAGASGSNPGSNANGGGGGGASAAATTINGGAGSSSYSSWGLVTSTGQNVSGTVWYAGGGAGSRQTTGAGSGGDGGGGAGGLADTSHGTAGTANTGGGGGGGWQQTTRNGGAGGSGIVIVRYAK